MKSQLKALISGNITELEVDLEFAERYIAHYYKFCDKADTSDDSKFHFLTLNGWKDEKRKINSKLKRLRALQVEVKKLSSYTTTKSKSDVINGKAYVVSLITTKEV